MWADAHARGCENVALRADRVVEMHRPSPLHGAKLSLAGASSGEIVPHGAYRGARKVVVALRTCTVFLPYLPLGARRARRLGEITAASRVGTERAGVEPKISEYLAISRTHGKRVQFGIWHHL